MTPQLQQAIRLLALSNLEIEAYIAEELEKNPLLETGDSSPDIGEPESTDSSEIPENTSTDLLMDGGHGDTDNPMAVDYDADTFHYDSAADLPSAAERTISMAGNDHGRGSGEDALASYSSPATHQSLYVPTHIP